LGDGTGASIANATPWVDVLNKVLASGDINTAQRFSMFLANVAQEMGTDLDWMFERAYISRDESITETTLNNAYNSNTNTNTLGNYYAGALLSKTAKPWGMRH
jgi:hypothetical protein